MKEIKGSEFESEVLKGGKVALDFYSTECPPCEALAPKFDTVAELFGGDVTFLKIFRQENRELAEKLGVSSSPTVLFFEDGEEVGQRLSGGIKRKELFEGMKLLVGSDKVKEVRAAVKPSVTECDVAILGGGPGGLTAGLYLCQAKQNAILIDSGLPGGNVSVTHQISNYPGFIDPQPGFMLSHYMSEQTKQCGTTYKVAVDVTKVDLGNKEIIIDEAETIRAKKIVIATGTSYNKLGVPGEAELKGNGISYCATCDAKYFGDKHAVVIGGGNSAIEEAEFITRFASKVTVVHQFDKFQANKMSTEKLLANPKVETKLSHEPRGFKKVGSKVITEVENMKTGEKGELESDGVFIFIGMKPNLDMFPNALELDDWGYIKTDEDKRTSLPDVYAVGDVSSKKYRQITTAIADGTIAAISITKELE